MHSLRGHSDYVKVVAFSRDGNRVVSGSWDNLVRIWNAETGALVSSFVGVEDGEVAIFLCGRSSQVLD